MPANDQHNQGDFMDDFLHNLRSGKLKQTDRNRRDFNDYKGSQRRAPNERRKTDYYAKVTNENFAMIKETLDALAQSQKRMADAVAERNQTQGRIADALESIARLMVDQGEKAESAFHPPEDDRTMYEEGWEVSHHIDGELEKTEETDHTDLMDIISNMRKQGDSWEKIARHFDEQDIPTVSGKGKWRGPAIKKYWMANA